MQPQLKITDFRKREQILGEICARHGFKGNGIDKNAPLLERLNSVQEYSTAIGNKETVRRIEVYKKVAIQAKAEESKIELAKAELTQVTPQTAPRNLFNRLKDGSIPALLVHIGMVVVGGMLVAKEIAEPMTAQLVHMAGWLLSVLYTAETIRSGFLLHEAWQNEPGQILNNAPKIG